MGKTRVMKYKWIEYRCVNNPVSEERRIEVWDWKVLDGVKTWL